MTAELHFAKAFAKPWLLNKLFHTCLLNERHTSHSYSYNHNYSLLHHSWRQTGPQRTRALTKSLLREDSDTRHCLVAWFVTSIYMQVSRVGLWLQPTIHLGTADSPTRDAD